MNEFKVGDKVRVKEFDCMALVSEVGSKQDRVAVHFENNEGFWTYLGDAIGVSLELVERAAPVAPMTADVAGIRERHAKASREVQAIIDRKWHGEALGAFRMCIPAQLTDSDIVITNSLNDVPELLEHLEEVVRQNAALREQLTAAAGALDAKRLISFEATVYDYNRAGIVAFKLPDAAPSVCEAAKNLFQSLAEAREPVWVMVNEAAVNGTAREQEAEA